MFILDEELQLLESSFEKQKKEFKKLKKKELFWDRTYYIAAVLMTALLIFNVFYISNSIKITIPVLYYSLFAISFLSNIVFLVLVCVSLKKFKYYSVKTSSCQVILKKQEEKVFLWKLKHLK